MASRKWLTAIAAILAFTFGLAAAAKAVPVVGEEFEIRKSYETSERASDGSATGSSSGHDTIVERVIAVRADGLELEYDLPKHASAEARSGVWQFPARVLLPHDGPLQLLNQDELEARANRWLKAANLTREVCGRWIFTWNAFRIDCDPQSVIKTIEGYDLRSVHLYDGAPYRDSTALSPGTLARKTTGTGGSTYSALMDIDPQAVRRARAESDVAVGEIMKQPVTMEAALRERAKEVISGTISVTFETDADNHPVRRTTVMTMKTRRPSGDTETNTATEILERRLLSAQPHPH